MPAARTEPHARPQQAAGYRRRGAAGALALCLALAGGGTVPVAAVIGLGLATQPAQAQNLFAPRVIVNGLPITEFEVRQRIAFLESLALVATEEEAIERLIEERLQRFEAGRRGVRATPEQVAEGMAEFAARYEMTTEQFIERLAEAGVEATSFRDFVEAGVMWRAVVRGEVGGRVVVTEADVDRAMETTAIRAVPRVQISEIVLPTDPRFAEAVAEIVPQIQAITSLEEFAIAARQVSAAPSRDAGGRVPDWLPVTNFPPNIGGQLAEMGVGDVLGPVDLPGGQAIAFLQLRARDAVRMIPPSDVEMRYARLTIPGGRSPEAQAEAARITARADTCGQVEAIAAQGPASPVTFVTQQQTDLPTAVALELARIDINETSAVLVDDQGRLVVLMLCHRILQVDPPVSRDQIRERVFAERANGITQALMARLRADAAIEYR